MAFQNPGTGPVSVTLSPAQIQTLKTEVLLPVYSGLTAQQIAASLNQPKLVANPSPSTTIQRDPSDPVGQMASQLLSIGNITQTQFNRIMQVPAATGPAQVPASCRAFDLFPGLYLFIVPADVQTAQTS